MANELVGNSIAKPTEPTKVPKSAPAPSEAVASVLDQPTAEATAAPTVANTIPEGFVEAPQDFSLSEAMKQGGFEIAPDTLQMLPAYADGSSPDAPINQSPLSVTERLSMTAGNKVGNLRFLKNRFGDAKLDKHGNYVVLKDGAWHRADAKGLGDGDAWERTKELIKDTADLADIAGATIGSMAGAAAGAIVGGVGGAGIGAAPGSIAGAALGGAAAEGIRSSLGRLIGTYDASPEEQMKDIGWEGLLAMGGQTVALGVKPALGMMKSAMQTINTSATNYAKEVSSAAWSQMLGQPRQAIRAAMDNPDAIIDTAQGALKRLAPGTSPLEAVDLLAKDQVGITRALATNADAALKGEYRKALGTLVSTTPDTFSIDVKTIVNDARLALHDAGYGKIVGSPGKEKFVPLSNAEIAQQLGVSEANLPKIIGPDTREALNKVAGILNDYSQFGTLSGKAGAAKSVELKRAVGESFSELMGDQVPASVKQVVIKAKNSLETGIGKAFTDHGVGETYVKMNNQYSTYKDAVDLVKNAVSSSNPADIDNMIKKLVSKSGSFGSLKEEAKSLADLVGHDAVDSLLRIEHAKSFVDFAPKSFGGNSATTIGKVVGAVTMQSNPRAVGAQIKYGNKTLDFLKGLSKFGPKQLNTLLSNDQAVQALFQIPMQAAGREDQTAQALLQQSGVPQ